MTSLEANVACGQPSSAASIWPVWLQSSSIACLPRMMNAGFSASITPLRILATDSGSMAWPSGVSTRMPRSAPIDSAVRIVSCDLVGPTETATISVTWPFSLSRTASSTAISSKGFIDILTLASSTPDPVRLDADLDVEVDHPLYSDQNFHSPRGSISGTARFPGLPCCTAILLPGPRQIMSGL